MFTFHNVSASLTSMAPSASSPSLPFLEAEAFEAFDSASEPWESSSESSPSESFALGPRVEAEGLEPCWLLSRKGSLLWPGRHRKDNEALASWAAVR